MLRSLIRPAIVAGLFLCALGCLPGAALAASPVMVIDGLGKGAVSLDGPWQFHLGDDTAWAAPGFDDSGWEQIDADKPWGLQGHESYSGFAWYRRSISITPAPGASADVALLIPAVDDIYEIYWNGVEVGHLGSMPPHLRLLQGVAPQTYGLGPVRNGVLAVRVWLFPLPSNAVGTGGGFEGSPLIGSPQAIAAAKGYLDFRWLRSQQFRFGLVSLYSLVALLSLVAWLRDRKQWLLFWMTIFASTPLLELFLRGLRLPLSADFLNFAVQSEIQIREISQWFLLLWLLQLHAYPKIVRFARAGAIFALAGGVIDGSLASLYPGFLNDVQFQIADAIFTLPLLLTEVIPVVLVVYAFARRQRLDNARWVVAFFAFLGAMIYSVTNVAIQGVRFTHWTLSTTLNGPLFSLNGNPINLITTVRTLLFVSIVYAVIRYSIAERHRQIGLEQEFRSARELQKVLVPETLPALPGFAVASAYRPAKEVGGDFFQIIPLEGEFSGSTLIVLGDVSGKGLKAAMAVSLIVGMIRALTDNVSGPAQLLAELNRRLHGRLQNGFATCLALWLRSDGSCILAGAGHPAPFLNQHAVELPGALPLGITPTMEYAEVPLKLREGDHFALYTDGLLEARNSSGEVFSFERLDALFASRPGAAEATQAAVDFGQDDDITVVTLTRLGSGQKSTTQLIALGMLQGLAPSQ